MEGRPPQLIAADGWPHRLLITNDMVFSDGWTTQTPVITGDATKGYLSTLTVDI